MFLRKQGFPEEGELVLCTVTKIFHHSVFVDLDEYSNRSALIHISEISPGRIRNLRDFVVEGKKVVCVVLRINQEKGHIDLSLRRVNERQRIAKNNTIKMEQKSEKIVELAAQKIGEDPKKAYENVYSKVSKKYSTLIECFEEVSVDAVKLESLGVEKHLAQELTELIKQRIKPPQIEIKGQMKITLYLSDGISIIKDAFTDVLKSEKSLTIKYGGAGKYLFNIISEDFKDAEKKMEKAVTHISTKIQKSGGTAEFKRAEA